MGEQVTFAPGQVWIVGPRYVGGGAYASDNGTGLAVRLVRRCAGSPDWWCTLDLSSGSLDVCDCDWCFNESRLSAGRRVVSLECNGS